MNQTQEILTRGVAEINVRENLEEKLNERKKLRVKFGIDPTGFDLTLGHAVPLRKLKQFQDAGHHIILLFGNFTAQIGDPTGKSQTRKVLTKEEVENNAKTYLEQASKILDTKKLEVVYNADWLENMSFSDVLKLSGNFTVSQMLERDMFQERMKKGQHINLVEFMYPLMQGYDSVPIKADVEIGGTDQLFNMMCARPIQKTHQIEPQNVITVPLLVGLDGKEKMSKSLGNYIALNDSSSDMFGKTMSIPDDIIVNYFELTTEISMEEIEAIKQELESENTNPRDIKIRLAKEIVSLYHSLEEANRCEEEFYRIFSERNKNAIPDDIETKNIASKKYSVLDLAIQSELFPSNSEARRKVQEGAFKIDGEAHKDIAAEFFIQAEQEYILQFGKRRFVKVIGE